jgi:PIN domain
MLTAFLDANVLFPVGLGDTLLWIAHFEVYSPRWSARVLDEMRRNVLAKHPQVSALEMDAMITDMRSAFPEAEVVGYERLEEAMVNAAEDRHVLAAAVIARAGVLVTNNVRDFPSAACEPYGIEAQSADEFLVHALTLEPCVVRDAVTRQAAIKVNPPLTVDDVLASLLWTAPTFVHEARLAWGSAVPASEE